MTALLCIVIFLLFALVAAILVTGMGIMTRLDALLHYNSNAQAEAYTRAADTPKKRIPFLPAIKTESGNGRAIVPKADMVELADADPDAAMKAIENFAQGN